MSFSKWFSKKAKKTKANYEEPLFVKTQIQRGYTYKIYKSSSAESAKEFLSSQKVDKKDYYIIVETHEGNWGIDVEGLFLEKLLPWQTNLSLAACEGNSIPISSFGIEAAARSINDNFIAMIKCGNCGTEWKDGIRFNDVTIVKCPSCKIFNEITDKSKLYLLKKEEEPKSDTVISWTDHLIANDIAVSQAGGNLFWFNVEAFEHYPGINFREIIYHLFIPKPPLISPKTPQGQKEFRDELNFYEGMVNSHLIERIPYEDEQSYVKYNVENCDADQIFVIGIHGDMDWHRERHVIITRTLQMPMPDDLPKLKFLGMTTYLKRDKGNPKHIFYSGRLDKFDGYARGVGLKRTLTLKSLFVERHDFKEVIQEGWFIKHGYKIAK
jgi:hypothetical protein